MARGRPKVVMRGADAEQVRRVEQTDTSLIDTVGGTKHCRCGSLALLLRLSS